MRERGRQQEIGVDFTSDRFRQRISVADQHPAFRFAFVMGDPSDHDQCERRQRQDGRQRREAQTPAQRTGLHHDPRPSPPDLPDNSPEERGRQSAGLGRRVLACIRFLRNPAPVERAQPQQRFSLCLRLSVMLGGRTQPAAAFATVFCDFRSKNKAWLITALTESALKGLVMRNAGSGAWPVKKRSGKAVMKMTGSS